MGLWEYEIENNEFDAQKFLPLCNLINETTPVTFDEPYPIDIDIDYFFHSDLFGTDNYYNIKVTGSIVGFTAVSGSIPYMPCVVIWIGDSYNQGYAGIGVRGANFDYRSTLTVIHNEVEETVQTNNINYGDKMSGSYTSGAYINVHHCTLPILLACDVGWWAEPYPDFVYDFMFFNDGADLSLDFKDNMWNIYTPTALPVLTSETLNKVMNLKEDAEEIPNDLMYVSRGIKGTWDVFGGFTQDPNAEILIKGFKIHYNNANETTGKFAFYNIPRENGDENLKMGIKFSNTPDALYYTLDGESWITPATPYLPFTWVWRARVDEIGVLRSDIGGYGSNNIPVFADEETAQNYITNNGVSIKDAINYDAISGKYPIENNTEYADDETAFGQVYTRAFFSQQYICDVSAIQEISNALFDTTQGGITGIFEDIKKGLEMYGDNVIDAVQSCMFFPINLNEVFTSVQSQNYIYFGGYKFDLQNSSVNKIIYPNGYKDFGSFEIKETFGHGNARNYAPYQRLYCYLPYIGFVELDIAKYIGKTANVRYYFDTRTGCCLATITANGVMIDYFNGQCGVSMPITLTDYSRYAQTQIQTLLSGGANLGGGGNVGEMVKSGANNFVGGLAESGAVGLGTVALGGLAMAGAVQGAKTLYGLTQNNINNFKVTKGASSSMLNQYLPQDVLFWFEVQDADETPNEQSLQGYPSNASGTIQSFSGYLEVDTVNLVCADATDNERAEIIAYLKSGVIL